MKKLVVFLSLISYPAAPSAVAQEKEYTLKLTQTELHAVVNILAQRPYAEVAGLIGKIQNQFQAQSQSAPKIEPPQ